jgi:hypothetical protein
VRDGEERDAAFDGKSWKAIPFSHVAASPNGPHMLRWVVGRLTRQHGRVVTFREAADMLCADIERLESHEKEIEQAKPKLMNELISGALPIWGKKDLPGGKENPAAQHELIAPAVFLDERVSLSEWNTVGPDPDGGTSIFSYRGPTFRAVKFYTRACCDFGPRSGLKRSPRATR